MAHWRLSVKAQTGATSTGSPYKIPRGRKIIVQYAYIDVNASAAGRTGFIQVVDGTQTVLTVGRVLCRTAASGAAGHVRGVASVAPDPTFADATYMVWAGEPVLAGLDQVNFTVTGGTGADTWEMFLVGQEYEESEAGF